MEAWALIVDSGRGASPSAVVTQATYLGRTSGDAAQDIEVAIVDKGGDSHIAVAAAPLVLRPLEADDLVFNAPGTIDDARSISVTIDGQALAIYALREPVPSS